jgi:hypothetical protein
VSRAYLVAAALLVTAAPAAAQFRPDTTASLDAPRGAALWRASWIRPVGSLVVPGAGQLLGGHARGAVYLALEALLITRALSFNSEGRRDRERYRRLATVVARMPFGAVRQDTVFEYYEQMGRWVESGPYDIDPGPDLVPPTDERTYNGQIWRLARTTYLADPDEPPDPTSPEYQRALALYRSRAIGPNFRWSWRNAGLEQDLYRQTIEASDNAFRSATAMLGLLLANHVLSAVDAFVTERLQNDDHPFGVQATLAPARQGRGGVRLWAVVSVGL